MSHALPQPICPIVGTSCVLDAQPTASWVSEVSHRYTCRHSPCRKFCRRSNVCFSTGMECLIPCDRLQIHFSARLITLIILSKGFGTLLICSLTPLTFAETVVPLDSFFFCSSFFPFCEHGSRGRRLSRGRIWAIIKISSYSDFPRADFTCVQNRAGVRGPCWNVSF